LTVSKPTTEEEIKAMTKARHLFLNAAAQKDARCYPLFLP
jgi:hypothetical protein